MKKYLFLILLVLFGSVNLGYAESLKFIWQANPVEDAITGYKLYQDCGGPTCVIATIQNPTTTTITIPAPKGNHSYSLTAYRNEDDGTVTESLHSAYAIYAPKPKSISDIGSFIINVIK